MGFWHQVKEFFVPPKDPDNPLPRTLLVPRHVYLKARKIFYDGPRVYNYPGRRIKGYRSPNLLIMIWIYTWINLFFTIPGRILFLDCAFFLITSLLMPIYYLSLTLVCLFLIDFIIGYSFKPKLQVQRSLPSLVCARKRFSVDYRIKNFNNRSCFEMIVDTLPLTNVQFPDGHIRIRSLQSGEEIKVENDCLVERRGVYDFPVAMVSSSFPFGLLRFGSGGSSAQTVFVHPFYFQLDNLDLPMGNMGYYGQEGQGSSSRDAIEYAGSREFRFGDSPRHIHAASWARLQKPIVKEFRDDFQPRIHILIDNYTGKLSIANQLRERDEQRFEAAMSLTAALADYLIQRQFLLDVSVPGSANETFSGKKGAGQLDALLRYTAELNAEERRQRHLEPDDLKGVGCFIIILLNYGPAEKDFLANLPTQSSASKIFLVKNHYDERAAEVADEGIILVDAEDIMNGKITRL